MMEMERLKMFYGFALLVVIATLAALIALGKVEEHTSYGLSQILGGLMVLAGGFAHWAFQTKAEGNKDNPEDPNKKTESENHRAG